MAYAVHEQVDKLYFALKESPELTQQLAGHVRDFALAAGWFTANTRWQKDKPEKDKQQASLHESQLGAPVYVTEVHFGEPQISISDPSKGVGLPITVFNPSKTEALEQVSKSYVTRLTSSVTKQVHPCCLHAQAMCPLQGCPCYAHPSLLDGSMPTHTYNARGWANLLAAALKPSLCINLVAKAAAHASQ